MKERGQYLLAFGVIASMLVVAKIPIFVVFFFGVFAFLMLKMLAKSTRSDTRDIFEFYLSANEILRDDDRKWFGFEISDTIHRGEEIIRRMSAAPPLIRFALGALYNKVGDHKAAVGHLSNVIERQGADESNFVYPTPELRNYVKVLRKIERDPADAPLTSSAIRALERARKLRGHKLLEESRQNFANGVPEPVGQIEESTGSDEMSSSVAFVYTDYERQPDKSNGVPIGASIVDAPEKPSRQSAKSKASDPFSDRKPISEVLHDIYDKNVQ